MFNSHRFNLEWFYTNTSLLTQYPSLPNRIFNVWWRCYLYATIFWFDLSFGCYGFVGCFEMDEGICFCWRWFLTKASMVVVMFVHNFYKTLTFRSCFSYSFMFFMFGEERDIKESKITYLTLFLTKVDNWTLIELTSSG